MQFQDKLFLVSGDGICSSSTADANSYCINSKKIMTYDWTLLQTLIFIITPFFVMLALTSENDEDDGPPDGGLMTPAYAPTPS